MKVCVFSDSHGYAGTMMEAVELEKPDACVCLGDGERDLAALEDLWPELPVYAVRGNCDFRSERHNAICFELGGVTIFATHGHMSGVKYEDDLGTLTSQALQAGAEAALFGHTHRQHLSYNKGVMLLNPGAAYHQCYAVLTIENGVCTAELMQR